MSNYLRLQLTRSHHVKYHTHGFRGISGRDVGFNFDGDRIHTEDFYPNSTSLINSIKSTGHEVHLDWKAVGFTVYILVFLGKCRSQRFTATEFRDITGEVKERVYMPP